MTDETNKIRDDFKKMRLEERKVSNYMLYCEHQAIDQKTELDKVLKYKDECLSGLEECGDSWLSVSQQREYKLLLQHLESEIDVKQFKVIASRENYQEAKKTWLGVSEKLKILDDVVKQQDELAKLNEEVMTEETEELIVETGKKKTIYDSTSIRSTRKSFGR